MKNSFWKRPLPIGRTSRSGIARAVLAATSAAGAAAALLASSAGLSAESATDESSAPALQEVVVTGSLISRTDSETPSPVQIISAEDIKNSGLTNFSDLMRNLSANGAANLSQAFGQAFASGGSGISLRGLTVGDTLVLIDGHRSVAYPLNDDNQRSFTDISAIPFNAIERIEVLKDGASSEYGADAIAGVVNVILKKDYQGAEFNAEAGTTSKRDGTTIHLSAIGGVGSLDSDGYNAYVAVDFHNQNQILATSRSGTWANIDWTGYTNGNNLTPGVFAPNLTGPYPVSKTGYLVDPTSGAITDYQPGCNAAQQTAGGCAFRYPFQIQPNTQQTNVLAKFTKQLSDDWTGHIEASFFNSKAEQVGIYASTLSVNGGFQNLVFSPTSSLGLVSYAPITVPATYPYNTTGTPQLLQYSWANLPENVYVNTNTYRLIAQVDGKEGGWDLDAAGGWMYSLMDNQLTGNINSNTLQYDLNNGYVPGATAASPTMTAPFQNFAPLEEFHPSSALQFIEAHASRPLFNLPGGPLSVAVGGQYFHKVQNETAPSTAISGEQGEVGGPVFVVGSQEDAAAFVEFSGNPIKQLELDASVRYDHIDTYGGSTDPKFGIKFQPIDMVALRGTWSKGFRAPSAAEAGASGELFGAGFYVDPKLCPNSNNANPTAAVGNYPQFCQQFVTGYQQANPNLKAVTSTQFTGGLIFEPFKTFNASFDYYNIKLRNDIISQFEAGGLGNYTGLLRGPTVFATYNSPTGQITQQTPVGPILALTYPYVNAGQTNTSGFDVDLRAHFDTDYGKFLGNLSYTHLISYVYLDDGVFYQLAGTHGPSGISGDTGNPKDRAVLSLGWEAGPVNVTWTINYTGSFSIVDASAGVPDCASAEDYIGAFSGAGPSQFCRVGSFTDVDLSVHYQVTDHFSVHGAIINLTDASPPVDVATYGGGGRLAYDPGFSQAGAIGRFFNVGFTYGFK